MSRSALSIPPMLIFASLGGELWGVAAGDDPARAALGRLDATRPAEAEPAELRRTGPGEWSLRRGEDALLSVEEAAEVAEVATEGAKPGLSIVCVPGSDEVAGIVFGGDAQVQADSVRMLFACFPENRAVGMLAVRPPRSKGQDRDEVSVACLGEPAGARVFDPRLSSTYGDGGLLRRVGLELWLGPSEEADLHSLRLAGETVGAVARLELDDAVIQAQPFISYNRGRSGVGVYALITRS